MPTTKEEAKVSAYLYNADGSDQTIDLDADVLESLNDKQLLWIHILRRDRKTIEKVVADLQLEHVPVESILNVSERPKLDKFCDFYRFFVASIKIDKKEGLCSVPIDYLVGKNFVITVSDGEVDYFEEFREREKGETNIGGLDADSLVASLLDLHIVTYFRVLENLECIVDETDEKILKRDLKDEDFLEDMVDLRKDVSKLRRWFLPHRDVFYALARPDFKQSFDTNIYENFQHLNEHFETAVDSIESSRDTVLSLFDLYTTKTAHRMNSTINRLTFITLMVGLMGVIAGILGMNFEESFFKSTYGFWVVIVGMLMLAIILTILARVRRWI